MQFWNLTLLEEVAILKDAHNLTAAQLSPEDAMYGHGFYPKKIWCDSLRFVFPTVGSIFVKTPRKKVDLVYQRLHEYLLEVDDDAEQLRRDVKGLDEGWPRMREMLRKNRGMTNLMLDHGCRSKIIYPYILAGSQAVSLEVFNGKAFDLAGDFVDVPYSDTAILYAVWEPIGVDIRERIKFEQEHIKMADSVFGDEPWEMLTCGAGLCSFLRMYDFDITKLNCNITAIDMDERNLKNMGYVFDDVEPTPNGCRLTEHRVNYEIADLHEFCMRPENAKRFKVVDLQGVLSYYRFGGKTKDLIQLLARVLADDGWILCDAQVLEISLVRCALCMGWVSELFPDWTSKSAIRRISKICKELGLSIQPRICSRNPRPTTVLFCLKKAA